MIHDRASRQSIFYEPNLVRRYAVTYAAPPAVKYTLLASVGLALLATTGCATSVGDVDLDGGEDLDGAKTDSNVNKDGAANKDGSSGECVAECTSDDQCQNSCPEVPNGINCCDTSTGICYAYSSQECPAPVQDAGFD